MDIKETYLVYGICAKCGFDLIRGKTCSNCGRKIINDNLKEISD